MPDKKINFLLVVTVFLIFISFRWSLDACYTICVGKSASASGRVIVAHNEDDYGNLPVNLYLLKTAEVEPNDLLPEKILRVLQPLNLKLQDTLWIEVRTMDFADSYLNQSGVLITSNACPSKEDLPELSDGGVGYYLRRAVALFSSNAQDALRIIETLISSFGYNSSGRTYTIADQNEIWLVHLVNGKRWVARRVPDDQVVVLANRYIIDEICLKEKENFRGSSDLVAYALRRGWYSKKKGLFNFAEVYGQPESQQSAKNYLRQWQGVTALSDLNPEPQSRLPFSFKPKKKISVRDLTALLRNHYENTDYYLVDKERNDSVHFTNNRTICYDTTKYSFVAEMLDAQSGLPAIFYLALGFPCQTIYNIIAFDQNEPLETFYQTESWKQALKNHFQKSEEDLLLKQEWNFMKILNRNLNNFRFSSQKTEQFKRAITSFEDNLFGDQIINRIEHYLKIDKTMTLRYLINLMERGERWRLLTLKELNE